MQTEHTTESDRATKTFRVSLFRNKTDKWPKHEDWAWEEIVRRVRTPEIRAEKDGALFSGARYRAGATRGGEGVEDNSLLPLDYDHGADFERDCAIWESLGFSFVAYTTHSSYRETENNPDAEERFRIVLPLEAPIPAATYLALWLWAQAMSGGRLDNAPKNAASIFYAPAVVSDDAQYKLKIHSGRLLDWREIELAEPKGEQESETPPANKSAMNGHNNGHRRAENFDGLRPGEDYSSRPDAFEKSRALLSAEGWTYFGDDKQEGGEFWARPGVTDHHGARLRPDGSVYNWTSNAPPLVAGESYTPFQLLTALKYNGDFSAAAKALAAEGYGEQRQNGAPKTEPKSEPPPEPAEESEPSDEIDTVFDDEDLRADHGNVARFLNAFREVTRYVYLRKKFLCFDGKRWSEDQGIVEDRVNRIVRSLRFVKAKTLDAQKKAFEHYTKSQSPERRNAILTLARAEIRATSKALLSLVGNLGSAIGLVDRLGQSLGIDRFLFRALEASSLLATGGVSALLIPRIERELSAGDQRRLQENRAAFGGAPSRFGLFGATRPAGGAGGGASVGGALGGDSAAARAAKEQAKQIKDLQEKIRDAVNERGKGNVEDLEEILKTINAANAAGEDRRQQLQERPAQLAKQSAILAERIRKTDLETLRLEENTAKKAQEALKKNEELLTINQRLMKGFADATITAGDAFERFGRNVAFAFGNVRDLFNGLKQAVFGFFSDLVGGTLQNLVRQTLGPIFGGGRGASAAAGLLPFGFGQGFGILGGGGAGGAAGAGQFNLGQFGSSLLNAAPLLGLTFGGALGGRSIGGQILGSAGGLLTGAFLTTTLGGSAFGGIAPALFSNPLTAIAGAGLLVGSVLLGKAKQRRADEEASGQMLTQAIQAIEQLRSAIASDQIDGSQARSIFENQILAQFRTGTGSLKTKSVRESRLSNQVNDLRKLFEDSVAPAIAAQEARKASQAADLATRSSNALIFARQIPEFATGGTTMGGLALLHPGEKVVNLMQQTRMRAIGGSNIFEMAGVPGIKQEPIFDTGGTMGRGGLPVVIENLTIGYMVGRDDASRAFVLGASTPSGQAVTVKNVKVARRDKQLG